MIVYFSGSARRIKEEISIYRRITHVIRELGHNIHNDWIETAWLQAGNGGKAQPVDMQSIVRNAELSIEGTELVVVEASDASTFGVGYETAIALQRKKPVLLLVRKEVASSSYAIGLRNELLTYKEYTPHSLERIVSDFIKDNTVRTKDLRFNFVIDRQIYNHLRAKSYRSGKTKAEVVRDLLLKDIDQGDL